MKIKDIIKTTIIFFVCLSFFMMVYPPAREAVAQTATKTHAGHGVHTCNAAAPTAAISGVLADDGRPLTEILIGNFTATPVFLTSRNGNPASEGWPICNDPSLCASAVSLPVYGDILSCSPAAGTVDVKVFGVN